MEASGFTRRQAVSGGLALGAALFAPPLARASVAAPGLEYLETLGPVEGRPFVAPSLLHPSYRAAVYVNCALSGPGAQKMWVLERGAQGWALAHHDEDYWQGRDDSPAYSWPVSTGRKYPGDSRSGPTPVGVFNIDDRRHRPGWGSPGMYNSLYIDLHYSGGRASGVAIHGTTRNQYGKLGRVDSHGCVRMRQANADKVWAMIHPGGARAGDSPLWGEIPRYFTSRVTKDMSPRSGYVRDGSLLYAEDGGLLTREGYRMVFVFFRDDP
ncbi:L,D-transpeptidase family protein [Pseudogemmobacter sonorensis]|uniref:L,D-transpeptidase n=1 Tax=Pseudogemmobacter sonorensis TaxID=2989681 RepID=UPI00368BC50E